MSQSLAPGNRLAIGIPRMSSDSSGRAVFDPHEKTRMSKVPRIAIHLTIPSISAGRFGIMMPNRFDNLPALAGALAASHSPPNRSATTRKTDQERTA